MRARVAIPIVAVGIAWYASVVLAVSPVVPNERGQATATPAAASPAWTAWDKVYTDAQAKRGQTVYLRECAACHADDLRGSGNAPALGGDDFLFLWENQTVGDLFERIRTLMPPDRPDSLRRETYRDIVAFLLRSNTFPAGEKDLDADAAALRQIQITMKPRAAGYVSQESLVSGQIWPARRESIPLPWSGRCDAEWRSYLNRVDSVPAGHEPSLRVRPCDHSAASDRPLDQSDVNPSNNR